MGYKGHDLKKESAKRAKKDWIFGFFEVKFIFLEVLVLER